MPVQRVRFPAEGEDPPMLEGELRVPEAAGPMHGVVVAHPHPGRGGSMQNTVVLALCQGLDAAGIAALRFNFRGVGLSEGRYGEGIAEVNDVLGALAFLAAQPGIGIDRLGLAGYSFGARVSLAVAARVPQLRALLCVAPPLHEPVRDDQQPACPLLVLVGDQDTVMAGGAKRYESLLPASKQLQVVAGTDHFWRGFEPVLVDAAQRFFATALLTPTDVRAPASS